MTNQHATLFVPAAPAVVCSILLQPLQIPDWNPAFLSLTGPDTAVVGVGCPITVRGGFGYSDIAERRIGWTWRVPGLHEVGAWRLTPQGGGTLVYHEFAHQGPLARVLRSAFEGVVHRSLGRRAALAASGGSPRPNVASPGHGADKTAPLLDPQRGQHRAEETAKSRLTASRRIICHRVGAPSLVVTATAGQTRGIQRHHLVAHTGQPPLAFADDLRCDRGGSARGTSMATSPLASVKRSEERPRVPAGLSADGTAI